MTRTPDAPTPLCSIIIPTYNHGRHIRRSVSSALAQTFKDKEVVIIDDGSTDDTREKVREFEGQVIYHRTENGGLGSARNRGISISRGRYLQFLDADDSIAHDKLQKQLAFLLAHPDVDIVYSDCFVVSLAGAKVGNASRPLLRAEEATHELLKANLMPVHASIVKRSAVIDVGLFDECRTALEDWDLWLRLAIKGFRFHYISGDLASYHREGSRMTTDAALMYRKTKHLLNKHRGSPDFDRLGNDYARWFVAHQSILLATCAYNNRWWRRSRQHFWQAGVSAPKLMTLRYFACIPKALAHQLIDRLSGSEVHAPDE